jgi:hypothetical protein
MSPPAARASATAPTQANFFTSTAAPPPLPERLVTGRLRLSL